MCSSSVSKINLSWRRREVCKLLLCFAQSSYYFRIGFAMDLCQEDIKDLCFGMHLDLYVRMHYALCTAREKPLLERRPEKPGRGSG